MKEMCLSCKVMMDKKLFVLTDIPMCEDCLITLRYNFLRNDSKLVYNKTLRE